MDILNPVLAVEGIRSVENEIIVLKKFSQFLSSNNEQEPKISEDLDAEWLHFSRREDEDVVNPFPVRKPEDLLKEQEYLNRFTFYLFERRYGWSEHSIHADEALKRCDSTMGRTASLEIESKYKGKLNDLLDDLLKWYLCQSKLSEKLLKSLLYVLSKASNLPVVRNQTLIHILDWLKVTAREGFESATFLLVKEFIVTGLTDVWSAIRNACVTRLSQIVDCFTIPQLECLFLELEQICKSKSSSWQASEGAVMGMTTIIRSFHVSSMPISDSDSSSSPKLQMFVKFGGMHLSKLPDFITDSLYTVVFSLLAHTQLSIREHASKAFTSILSRSESQFIEKSFRQVIIHLCKGTGVDMNNQKYQKLPHHAVLREGFTFLDAYEAQGLLEVSIFLIKRIPVNHLMERWPLYFSTFNLYLMHPASTVRQASSVVFKYLVTKDNSSPNILRLVLQCLCEPWKTSRPAVNEDTSKKVHCKQKTFSRVCSDCLEDSSEICVNTSKCKRPSIKSINKIIRDMDEKCFENSLSLTWEWREGRLFAYELILKYLIANHIHYVFPSYALSYSTRQASCSVDEAMLRRTRGFCSYSVPTYTGIDSSCSLSGTKSTEVLEGGQNISGRCSAPGTRKEKFETLNSNNLDLGCNFPSRVRTSSFTNNESPLPHLVRQSTVAVFNSRTVCTPSHKQQNNAYFADSLLNKAKFLDQTETKRLKKKTTTSLHEKSSKHDKDCSWITPMDFDSFCSILTQILYQTIDCLEDSRWELRRMSQQILPLVAEAIRWFDISILEDFWTTYLSRTSPLFCYSGCIALKYSISHARKLRQFIDRPPATWKDIESCCSSAMSVFCSVNNGLQVWMPKIISLLQETLIYDKITVSAMEVLLTRQTHLPLDCHSQEKYSSEAVVCDVITSLFLKAHPDSLCATSLKNSRTLNSNWDRKLFFPTDEFSCLSSKGLTLPEQARQTERFLFLELHSLISQFLGSCCVNTQVVMLPILVHSLHSFCDDTTISHSLISSISKVADNLQEKMNSTDAQQQLDKSEIVRLLDLAIWEFSFLITQRSIDLAVLKQLQEMFLIICEYIEKPDHLKDLFQALSMRLNFEPDLICLIEVKEDEDDNVPCSELQLLSNDIHASPVSESPLLQADSDDDEIADDSVDRVIQESVALNHSLDSMVNGGTNGREESGAESDLSDWDSCEDLVQDNAREAIEDFVNQLFLVFQKKKFGIHYFMQELKTCGESETLVIRSILESGREDC